MSLFCGNLGVLPLVFSREVPPVSLLIVLLVEEISEFVPWR